MIWNTRRSSHLTHDEYHLPSPIQNDAITAHLEAIEVKLDILVSLKEDVAALKTLIYGTSARCNNERGESEIKPSFGDFRDNKKAEDVPQGPLTDRVEEVDTGDSSVSGVLEVAKSYDCEVTDEIPEGENQGKNDKQEDLCKGKLKWIRSGDNEGSKSVYGVELWPSPESNNHKVLLVIMGRYPENSLDIPSNLCDTNLVGVDQLSTTPVACMPITKGSGIDIVFRSTVTHHLVHEVGQPMIEWLIAWPNGQQISSCRLEDKSFYPAGCIDTNPSSLRVGIKARSKEVEGSGNK